jgi:hypothetical protein
MSLLLVVHKGWLDGLESGFYSGVDLGLGEFGGDTDAVHDRLLVGGAVAYDADSADAEEGSSTVFGVVETLLELLEGFPGQKCAYLGGDGGLERLAE